MPTALNTSRYQHAQVTLDDGRILIVGGIEMFRDLTELSILRRELEGTYRVRVRARDAAGNQLEEPGIASLRRSGAFCRVS